jgi:hypothetical protein
VVLTFPGMCEMVLMVVVFVSVHVFYIFADTVVSVFFILPDKRRDE